MATMPRYAVWPHHPPGRVRGVRRPTPAGADAPAVAAWRRSVNVLLTLDSARGLSIDPPIACHARNATSQRWPGARLHSGEQTVNTTGPAWNVLRRLMLARK